MLDLFLDPLNFFRSSSGSRWAIAAFSLVGIQLIGIAFLFTRMALYIPDGDLSLPVVGYVIGLGISAFVSTVSTLAISFVVFWILTWFCRDRLPLSRLCATYGFALIPGHFGTLAVRLAIIGFSEGSISLSRITNSTSLAAFVNNPSDILTLVDPFLAWSVVLLAIGYSEITGGKRSWWFSFCLSLLPIFFTRIL